MLNTTYHVVCQIEIDTRVKTYVQQAIEQTSQLHQSINQSDYIHYRSGPNVPRLNI